MENITLLEELSKLREENKRLKQLLKIHNINYDVVEKSTLSVEEKITIYKSFFKGRTDVFTEKFIRKDGSKGYSIVCSNKKRIIQLSLFDSWIIFSFLGYNIFAVYLFSYFATWWLRSFSGHGFLLPSLIS